jgi:hypothetical protein
MRVGPDQIKTNIDSSEMPPRFVLALHAAPSRPLRATSRTPTLYQQRLGRCWALGLARISDARVDGAGQLLPPRRSNRAATIGASSSASGSWHQATVRPLAAAARPSTEPGRRAQCASRHTWWPRPPLRVLLRRAPGPGRTTALPTVIGSRCAPASIPDARSERRIPCCTVRLVRHVGMTP